jgi:dipeptidase D
MEIRELTPQNIWGYFSEIVRIPRPSRHEEKMIEFLESFAKANNLAFKRDNAGNVLIRKEAAKGKENIPTVVLQSHIDMVCEKNSNVVHDFLKDPINAYIDGEWVKAHGTTLGADDGIGVAATIAILTDNSIGHGPLECLFTVDEETGLTGAFELEPGLITGKTLINLDSEDEGEIFIGCAGGRDTIATFPVQYTKCDKNLRAYIISITGLKGGHSGDDIHRGHGNAIKMITEFLLNLDKHIKTGLHRLEGGHLRNAIPREAFASITVDVLLEDSLINLYHNQKDDLLKKWLEAEPGLKINIEPINNPFQIIDIKLRNQLLQSIYQLPNGVIAWHKDIPDLVETSTNLASVKFTTDNTVEIVTSQRSSSDVEKDKIVKDVASVFMSHDADVQHSKGYPGWTPDMSSPILKKSVETYTRLFNMPPKVKAIHAGLECGLFLEKNPGLDMISIGPTIKGVHSPDERLLIPSVQKFWDLLVAIIE